MLFEKKEKKEAYFDRDVRGEMLDTWTPTVR